MDSTPLDAGLGRIEAPDIGAPLADSGPLDILTPGIPALSPGCDRASKQFCSLREGVLVARPLAFRLPETTSDQSGECFGVEVNDGRGEVEVSCL